MLLILGLALSSSLDNLGVGISYGIRSIKIGVGSNLLISGVCLVFSFCGIMFGRWISAILPGSFPIVVSAALLLAIGLRIIMMSSPCKKEKPHADSNQKLGLFSILKNPELADMDSSKHISLAEALVLGAALSTNALTNGLSAGLVGLSPLAISITAAAGSFATLLIGASLGQRAAHVRVGKFELGQFGTLISGMLLVVLAIRNFF
jgi:putative sporulation protein YtaF